VTAKQPFDIHTSFQGCLTLRTQLVEGPSWDS